MAMVLWHFVWAVFTLVTCEAAKPNIIVILIDDLGWNDLGFHGSDQIRTPNMDALAYSGMILNRHYVLPTCTPSRSALLTGLYPIRTGMQGYPLKGGENRQLPLDVKLQPEYLRDLGYQTHMVGKWHLGYQTQDGVPNRRGFDSFFGYYNGYVDYYKFGYNQTVFGDKTIEYYYGYDLHRDDDVFWTDAKTYATTLFTDEAETIIRRHNQSRPLYLYFSHLATHTGDDDIGMEVPRDARVDDTYGHIKDAGRRAFAGCLEELDKSVGRVVKALRETNMLDNSIILLMSDNGGHTVSIDMPPNWSSNWPLAGTKFTMYEGGVRGGAVVWSPLLPGGVTNDGFMHIADWLPTLYSAAGGDVSKLKSLDGIDQWAALKRQTTVKRSNLLLNIDDRLGSEGIIIENRWKVVKGGYPGYASYDGHWGREKNTKSNPPYDVDSIVRSDTGTAIRSLGGRYEAAFAGDSIGRLRRASTVTCGTDAPGDNTITVGPDGYLDPSDRFRCPDFCLFDIVDDPCELRPIADEDIVRVGQRLLQGYKGNMVRQRTTIVVPESNPENFGGVWMPWESKSRGCSFTKYFAAQYMGPSVIITLTWYLLRGM